MSRPKLVEALSVADEPREPDVHPSVRWVVRGYIDKSNPYFEYSASPELCLFQLTPRARNAHCFDSYVQASAHARHLSFIYRVEFEVAARTPAGRCGYGACVAE